MDDPLQFLEGYDMRVISGGNFGCVFEMLPKSSGEVANLADKVEIVNTQSDLKAISESTKVHTIVSASPSPPGIVKLYRTFILPGIPASFLEAMGDYTNAGPQQPLQIFDEQAKKNRCSTLRKEFENFTNYRGKVNPGRKEIHSHHTIMEFARGGNLWQLIAIKSAQGETFPGLHILDVIFTLAYSLSELWDKYGFIHGDIRAKNIVLDTSNARDRRLIYAQNQGKNTCPTLAGETIPNFLAKITDFGNATIKEQRQLDDIITEYHGIYFSKEPPFVLFVDVPLILQGTTTIPRKSPYSDMWGLGLIFLSQLLCGVTGDDLYPNPLGLHLRANSKSAKISSAFESMIFHALYKCYSRYARGQERINLVLYHTHKIITTLPGICLLNHILGNRLLPAKGSRHGFEFSPVYKIFERNSDLLLEMGELEGSNPQKSVYTNITEEVLNRFGGTDVLEFLKKLFAWDNMNGGFQTWRSFVTDPIFGCYGDAMEKLVNRNYFSTDYYQRKGSKSIGFPKFPDNSYITTSLRRALKRVKIRSYPKNATWEDVPSIIDRYPIFKDVQDQQFFKKSRKGLPTSPPPSRSETVEEPLPGYEGGIATELCSNCAIQKPLIVCPCLKKSYCSHPCRKVDWELHKKRCMYSFANK